MTTMQRIKKAVIPAAGLGTRFLPATKGMAKEIIPILDKPVIQFIIEELLASGIEEIMIITGRNKRSIEDHFDANFELEQNLISKGKLKLLEVVRDSTLENLQFKRQHHPKGIGDAVQLVKSFVEDEPFVLAFGDDVMASEIPATKQLIKVVEKYGTTAIMTKSVSSEEAKQYGIVHEETKLEDGVYEISGLIEKPQDVVQNPIAICGRYVLTNSIFEAITEAGVNESSGEIEITDALDHLAKSQQVLSVNFEGEWYEVGDPLGLVKASVQYALKHEETKDDFRDLLKNKIIPNLK